MKFYMREPNATLASMAGLTLEQIGLYNLILDLLYACDGIVPNNDATLAHTLHVDPRQWRRLKAELTAAGKIRVTMDGRLTANRVDEEILRAQVQSKLQQHRANIRWTNYRKAKENNGPAMPAGNASTTRTKKEREEGWAVNSGDKSDNSEPEADQHFGEVKVQDTPSWAPDWTTGELAALIQAKGWTR